jgi:hypothetical protein
VAALSAFRFFVIGLWCRSLRRRSQKTRITWERMARIALRYLPPVRVTHPFPNVRFHLTTYGKSRAVVLQARIRAVGAG